MSAKGDSGGVRPSDVNPSLPDNAAEKQASKDYDKQSLHERTYNHASAKQSSDSLWSSIWDSISSKNK